MTAPYALGQIVSYTNGQPYVCTAKIVGFNNNNLLVIDIQDTAGFILHSLGYKVATEITANQIK